MNTNINIDIDREDNYKKLINNTLNNALIPDNYLQFVKNETDREKRFIILKKYFSENITKCLYQNMDLLNAIETDFEQFRNMYMMIAQNLFINLLLAVETLVTERQ